MFEWIAPKYVRFILLPPREQYPVWYYDEWCKKVEPVVGEMLMLLKKDYSIHSLQGPAGSQKITKFGRLGWDNKSHQKWTLNSPLTKGKRDNWLFDLFCIYSPSRHVLVKSASEVVDFYFEVQPMGWKIEDNYEWIDEVSAQYHQALLVVVRKKLFEKQEEEFVKLIYQLSLNLMNAPIYKATRRIWGLNCVEDIYLEEFIYFGCHKDRLPDLSKTKKRWKRIR